MDFDDCMEEWNEAVSIYNEGGAGNNGGGGAISHGDSEDDVEVDSEEEEAEEEELEILPPRQPSQAQRTQCPPRLLGGQTTIKYFFARSNVNIFGGVTGGNGGDGDRSSGRGDGGGNVSITVSQSGQSEASAVAAGDGAASQVGGSHSRRSDLPPALQEKSKRARQALSNVASAAAAKKLRNSFSTSSPVF